MNHTQCYHCEQPVPQNQHFEVDILGQTRVMCCPGCQAVAEAIVANQLQDYYRFRTEPAIKADNLLEETLSQLGIYDESQLQDEFVSQQGDLSQIQLTLEGISCAACGWLIEKQLSRLTGIGQVAVNVAARRTTISWHSDQLKLSQILSTIESIGYHAMPFQPDRHEASYRKENKTFLRKLGLAGLMTMQVMMLAVGLYFSLFGHIEDETREFFHWVSMILTLPVVLYSGVGFYLSALKAISAGTVNMDVPISIAVVGAYAASCLSTIQNSGPVYFESVCMFIFLLLVSRYLEHRSRHKAAEISANTIKHIPLTANLVDDQGQISSCTAKSLKTGQKVLVRPGETVPIDGQVITGQSQIDESMLTGEFEPVSKTSDSTVYAGTINQSGVLTLIVDKPLNQALVSQITQMQELALASKPRISMLADRLSRHFVLFVLVAAAASYGYWTLQGADNAFTIAIAVLVATCPCALGLATPMALTCSLARLNRVGILIKQADLLERILGISHIAFDKTGTLTQGKFSISQWSNHSQQPDQEIQAIAASLEQYSEHPIARAFDAQAPLFNGESIQVEPGFGLEGKINQQAYRIGSAGYIRQWLGEAELPEGNVYLATQQALLASFRLNDQLKPEAKEVCQALTRYQQMIISGDREHNVSAIAQALQLDQYHSQATPEQKLQFVQTMQSQGSKVMMVGDGINDSPVLAAADVSVAVGGASDLAKSAADVVLLSHNLSPLPHLMTMACRTQQKVRQNIGWALGYNVLVLPLAVSGLLSPWIAVIGMSLSSIVVVSNSMRLLR